jgi:hypothetical protein
MIIYWTCLNLDEYIFRFFMIQDSLLVVIKDKRFNCLKKILKSKLNLINFLL